MRVLTHQQIERERNSLKKYRVYLSGKFWFRVAVDANNPGSAKRKAHRIYNTCSNAEFLKRMRFEIDTTNIVEES